MNPDTNNCPHCGAEEITISNRPGGMPIDGWRCGTLRMLPENNRSTLCLVREDWNRVRTDLHSEREEHNKTKAELAKAMSMIERNMEGETVNSMLEKLVEIAIEVVRKSGRGNSISYATAAMTPSQISVAIHLKQN
jgi:hypothetical protein